MPTNLQKLEEAGLIAESELPSDYATVVDNLSEEEVDVLVKVKDRLDKAGAKTGKSKDDTTTYIFI